jgi:gelsolin
VYIWLGNGSTLQERRLAVQYAQRYLYQGEGKDVGTPIVRFKEGEESDEFRKSLRGD